MQESNWNRDFDNFRQRDLGKGKFSDTFVHEVKMEKVFFYIGQEESAL
jgi:hypothetical protein